MLNFQNCCKFDLRDELPSNLALYAVYSGDELLYVGMSWNLKIRFKRHHKIEEFYKENADIIKWQLFDDLAECAKAEIIAIIEEKPKLNAGLINYNPPCKSTFLGTKPEKVENFGVIHKTTLNHLWQFIESHVNPAEALRQIQYDTGLNVPWLKTFASGQTKEPGVSKVELLYKYLTGNKIQL